MLGWTSNFIESYCNVRIGPILVHVLRFSNSCSERWLSLKGCLISPLSASWISGWASIYSEPLLGVCVCMCVYKTKLTYNIMLLSKKEKGKSLWAEGQKVSVLLQRSPVAHPPASPHLLAFTLQRVKIPSVISGLGKGWTRCGGADRV